MLKHIGQTWNNTIEPRATFTDIDEKSVKVYIIMLKEKERLPDVEGVSTEDILINCDLLKWTTQTCCNRFVWQRLSLDEPYQEKEITTLVHSLYPDIDNEIKCSFKSVLPERTFLEKLFLLHEEYQKNHPRTTRMSRHLYDLEKMIDTSFAEAALQNADLYKTVIHHRKKFNHIQGLDYNTLYPEWIQICPPENLMSEWEKDYRQLQESFIYEKSKSFVELIDRLEELTNRIRTIKFDD